MAARDLLPFLSAFLAGCVSAPETHKAELELYGPKPQDYESVVKAYYRQVLHEPDSVEYLEISEPEKTWVGLRFNGASHGYLVCVRYKAKAKGTGDTYVEIQDALLLHKSAVDLRVPNALWFPFPEKRVPRRLCDELQHRVLYFD